VAVDKSKLGISEDGQIDVVNLKCNANMLPSMWEEQGVFPAYHMSNEHWLTVALDGSVNDNNLKFLLEQRYDLTNKRNKNNR